MNKNSTQQVSLGTLYDFNKQIMAQQEKISQEEIENKKSDIEAWFNWQIDSYAMLLCRERHDYTIFHLYEKQNLNPPKVAVSELIETLNNRGLVLSIEKEDDSNHWEIWLKIGEEAFVYYLFNCDDFVIEC